MGWRTPSSYTRKADCGRPRTNRVPSRTDDGHPHQVHVDRLGEIRPLAREVAVSRSPDGRYATTRTTCSRISAPACQPHWKGERSTTQTFTPSAKNSMRSTFVAGIDRRADDDLVDDGSCRPA